MSRQRDKLVVLKAELKAGANALTPRLIGSEFHSFSTRSYAAEQRSVNSGKRSHYLDEKRSNSRMFLRRSVHRLEKALVSVPRRDSFAAEYIERTVRTFLKLSAREELDSGEMQWSRDVLVQYFVATSRSQSPRIARARSVWNEYSVSEEEKAGGLGPFPFVPLEADQGLISPLKQVAYHRRSVRRFDQVDISRQLIEESIEVGLTAPSACNRQSLRVILIDDPELRLRVASIPMGTAGFAHQIPVLAVLIGQHRGYEHQRDRHAIYVDGGLFTTGFILALEAQGVNSCCINWPELADKDRQISQALRLDPDERVIMLIAIGRGTPEQLVPRSKKRDVRAVAEWR